MYNRAQESNNIHNEYPSVDNIVYDQRTLDLSQNLKPVSYNILENDSKSSWKMRSNIQMFHCSIDWNTYSFYAQFFNKCNKKIHFTVGPVFYLLINFFSLSYSNIEIKYFFDSLKLELKFSKMVFSRKTIPVFRPRPVAYGVINYIIVHCVLYIVLCSCPGRLVAGSRGGFIDVTSFGTER
jgi:hypothetical protein